MLGRQRDLDQVRQALAAWLRRRLPEASGLEVSALRAPKAGVSNETFLFDVDYQVGGAAKHERLVARLEPRDFLVFPEYDLGRQYEVMARLAGTSVRVPTVRWLEHDPATLGGAFYVMDAVDGEVPSEVPSYHVYGWVHDLPPDRRARIWWQGVEAMADVHALDWRALGLGFLGEPSSPAATRSIASSPTGIATSPWCATKDRLSPRSTPPSPGCAPTPTRRGGSPCAGGIRACRT